MKPRLADECLVASTDLIARTRSKLAELQFSLDKSLSQIEVSADAIAASQALLAKFDRAARNGADAEIEQLMAPEQTSDGSP